MIQPAGFHHPLPPSGCFAVISAPSAFLWLLFSRLRGRSAPAVTSGWRWPSEDPEDSRSPALLISILQSCRP